MEPDYSCTWISFRNQKNEKKKKLMVVNENYIYCPQGIILRNNWFAYCIPWICRQLKHHQLRIRSAIFISLEIILNALMFDSINFDLNPYFGYSATFVCFSLHPLWICYAARYVHFPVPSGRRGALFFQWEQMHTSGSTFIKKIKPLVCHYISMPR